MFGEGRPESSEVRWVVEQGCGCLGIGGVGGEGVLFAVSLGGVGLAVAMSISTGEGG